MRFSAKLKGFIREENWVYAKTMPEWPHEYLVRDRVDEDLFEALVRHIRENGYEGNFYSKTLTYFDEDGLVYWTMGEAIDDTVIINRCKKADTYESRLIKGTLPD